MDHAARINIGCIKGHKISADYLQISCQTSHQLRYWVAIGTSMGVGAQKDLGGSKLLPKNDLIHWILPKKAIGFSVQIKMTWNSTAIETVLWIWNCPKFWRKLTQKIWNCPKFWRKIAQIIWNCPKFSRAIDTLKPSGGASAPTPSTPLGASTPSQAKSLRKITQNR